MKQVFSICLMALVFIACNSSPVPKDILPPEQMYPAIKDMILVDEFINNYVLKDSTINLKYRRTELYEKVFELHHTSRKQFYESYKFYQKRPDLMKSVFDSLSSVLKKRDYAKPQILASDSLKTDTSVLLK